MFTAHFACFRHGGLLKFINFLFLTGDKYRLSFHDFSREIQLMDYFDEERELAGCKSAVIIYFYLIFLCSKI
jgi:hypothetical protein